VTGARILTVMNVQSLFSSVRKKRKRKRRKKLGKPLDSRKAAR